MLQGTGKCKIHGHAGFTTPAWHEECRQASKDGSCNVTLQVRQFARYAASIFHVATVARNTCIFVQGVQQSFSNTSAG